MAVSMEKKGIHLSSFIIQDMFYLSVNWGEVKSYLIYYYVERSEIRVFQKLLWVCWFHYFNHFLAKKCIFHFRSTYTKWTQDLWVIVEPGEKSAVYISKHGVSGHRVRYVGGIWFSSWKTGYAGFEVGFSDSASQGCCQSRPLWAFCAQFHPPLSSPDRISAEWGWFSSHLFPIIASRTRGSPSE